MERPAQAIRESEPILDVPSGLVQLSRLVQAVQTRVAERHDLTGVQAKLICMLLNGPRGMADLAQALGVEKAALTGLMDRVERRDLARRTAVPGDRRALQVTLTDVGRSTALAFHAEATAELALLAEPLSTERSKHFRAALGEIIDRSQCR